MDITFSFQIYHNFSVLPQRFILEYVLSCVVILVYYVIFTSFFGYGFAFDIEGVPSIKYTYVIILMYFYMSP